MRKRIAKKIERSVRRSGGRYSREQVRVACLRLYRSPLYITDATGLTMGLRWTNGRAISISPKCFVLEQRRRLWRWIRNWNTKRVELHRVQAHFPDWVAPRE